MQFVNFRFSAPWDRETPRRERETAPGWARVSRGCSTLEQLQVRIREAEEQRGARTREKGGPGQAGRKLRRRHLRETRSSASGARHSDSVRDNLASGGSSGQQGQRQEQKAEAEAESGRRPPSARV